MEGGGDRKKEGVFVFVEKCENTERKKERIEMPASIENQFYLLLYLSMRSECHLTAFFKHTPPQQPSSTVCSVL